jgi:hypothetical protein
MTNKNLFDQIRNLIALDKIAEALKLLRRMFESSPHLDDILHQSGRFHNIRKEIRLGLVNYDEASITENRIRFGLLDLLNELEQDGATPLPLELAQNLVAAQDTQWVLSLRQDLLDQGVSVKNLPTAIMEHYGWLIEAFLQKVMTKQKNGAEHPPLLRLSYMAEAYQSTMRYLSYILLAQILESGQKAKNEALNEFVQMGEKDHADYDFLNLLLVANDLLQEKTHFMPEIKAFVAEFSDTQSDLYEAMMFLAQTRRRLLMNTLPSDTSLSTLLDEYLTALVFLLRRLAFLAKYRLASIKNISLNYRMGTAKKFLHLYGELHGIYNAADTNAEDYNTKDIEDVFTFNQSVLLFKGSNVDVCLDNITDPSTFISLTPLIIDQSVLSDKATQTPEVFYFIGNGGSRQYDFAQFRNELPFGERTQIASNKYLRVKPQNNEQAKLNDLFKQMDLVFKPFKTTNK